MAITVPNTFVTGTTAVAAEINANFAAILAKALDKTGDSMTGTLTAPDAVIAGTLVVGSASPLGAANIRGNLVLSMVSAAARRLLQFTNDAGQDFDIGAGIFFTGTEYTDSAYLRTFGFWNNQAGPVSIGTNGVERIRIESTGVTKFTNQFYNATVVHNPAGTTHTIDFNGGNVHYLVLDENLTLTLSNPVDGGRYVFWFVQDTPGGNTVTWPTGAILWPDGVAPTITSSAAAVSIVTLIYNSTLAKYGGAYSLDHRTA
jgi:hypothetical protein